MKTFKIKVKSLFMTILVSVMMLWVASGTIFAKEPIQPFLQTISSYYKYYKCDDALKCFFYIYPDKEKSSTGLKYIIPPSIMKEIIKDYMKQSKTLYS